MELYLKIIYDRRWKKVSRLLKSERGQAMVEFALIVPMLLILLCGMIDFGWLYLNRYQVDNAAFEGVRYVVINGADTEIAQINQLKTQTENEVKGNLGTWAVNPNVTATIQSDKVTVNVKCKIKMLTFVGQTFIGQYYDADSTSVGAR